jgi:PAS domain S-box-containing protein
MTIQSDRVASPPTDGLDSILIRNILDSMSDSLLVLGEHGQVLYANRATKDILGYSFDDLKTKGLKELFCDDPSNFDFNQVFLDAIWKKSINSYSEVDYHHPDGAVRRLAVTTSYFLADGEHESFFIGFIALFKDVTEISRLQRIEKELTEEKERIAKEKISSLQKLAMGVAHEIRNPMVTMGGFAARILRDMRNPEETRHYAKNILEDARTLEKIVDHVQLYCNLPPVNIRETNATEPVLRAISALSSSAESENVTLMFRDLIHQNRTVCLDPDLIQMAVENLLENAIHFSPKDSTVEIRTYAHDDEFIIQVQDSGSGIEEKDKSFIFDPFYSTRRRGPGMGLAIVERIVNEHAGRLEVESAPGIGTVVQIILPQKSIPRIDESGTN